jgi:hypothetical protein
MNLPTKDLFVELSETVFIKAKRRPSSIPGEKMPVVQERRLLAVPLLGNHVEKRETQSNLQFKPSSQGSRLNR